jgi:hypothetical protein
MHFGVPIMVGVLIFLILAVIEDFNREKDND